MTYYIDTTTLDERMTQRRRRQQGDKRQRGIPQLDTAVSRAILGQTPDAPANVIVQNGYCPQPQKPHLVWSHSPSPNQLCAGFITTSNLIPFLIPLVEMFVLTIRRDPPEGFSKFSKLTELEIFFTLDFALGTYCIFHMTSSCHIFQCFKIKFSNCIFLLNS